MHLKLTPLGRFSASLKIRLRIQFGFRLRFSIDFGAKNGASDHGKHQFLLKENIGFS